MKNRKVIIFLAALFLVTAVVLFISDDIISPYVSFEEAFASPGKYVQIIGMIDHSSPVLTGQDGFTFSLIGGDGDEIRVFSSRARPLNFDHAEEAVAIGRYDDKMNIFEAERLLIKCPSKYERKK